MYVSDETGRDEVWVRELEPNGERWQVSTGGRTQPGWSDRISLERAIKQAIGTAAVHIFVAQQNRKSVGAGVHPPAPPGVAAQHGPP